ncbi:LuxR family transcriptional regulator [Micromonospora arborensis]|uniref:LuxR family transcriptional regulator n=1 Tax=Micromonospora arborensis TaxID=2116518 RepID=A0A318NK51_9ACTN|nr:LuxR family transcriptional regulator [Micromonospora arborensis]PYC63446.1 LuxR family transcriptional regulator [Micromonospora arborensis]
MPVLVERDHELNTLMEMLDEAAGGTGRVALISGGLATGKTELVQAFAERITDRDVLLMTGGGAPAERDLPMGVLWQLLRSSEDPDLLARAVALMPADPTGPGVPPAVHGLTASLLEAAADRTVVLVVDDLHHVDVPTLQVLLRLRRQMRHAAVLMVLTEEDRRGAARTLLQAEVGRQPHRRLSVGTLTAAATAHLVERCLGTYAAALGPAVHRMTGGNPLLVHALVADQRRAGRTAGAEPVPGAAFRQEVGDVLHRAGPEVAATAAAAAVLGMHAAPEPIGELLDRNTRAVTLALDVLRDAGLLNANRLLHPHLEATVLEGLPQDDLVRMHECAAGLLYRDGADVLAVARHLIAADVAPVPWGGEVLRRAADLAGPDDHRLSVRCLELVLRSGPDDEVAVRAALMRLAWRANPSAGTPHLPALRTALAAGRLGWRDVVPVVRHLLWQGDLAAAADVLRAARTASGPADPHVLAELRFSMEWPYGPAHDRLPADVRSWLTAPDASGSPLARFASLARGGGSAVVDSAEHILQSCLGDVLPEVGTMALLSLEWSDRPERAQFWSVVLAEEAARRGAVTWSALLGCVRAELAWRRGDLAGAEGAASAALDLLPSQSWGVLAGWPLATMVLARTAMGRFTEAAETLQRPVPEATATTVFGARLRHAAGCLNLATGRPLAAVDELERCGALLKQLDLDLPAMVPWRSDLGRAYLAAGSRLRARELAADQADRAETRTRALSLRVMAAAGDVRNRAALLSEAVALLEQCGDRLEQAYALADLSQVRREIGDLGEARLLQRRSRQELKACQAASPPRGGEAVVPDPVPAVETVVDATTLSEAERNVAGLAALGYTNRQIGRTLFITVSTVEQHLTRVYRKLRVTRRTDLPAKLPA